MAFTKIDSLFKQVKNKKKVYIADVSKELEVPVQSITKIARYLENVGLVRLDYKNIKGPAITYVKSPKPPFGALEERSLINKLKFYKSFEQVNEANRLVMGLYAHYKETGDEDIKKLYSKIREYYVKNFMNKYAKKKVKDPVNVIDSYEYNAGTFKLKVEIVKQELEAVPFYMVSLLKMSDVTRLVVEEIKNEIVGKLTFQIDFKSHEEEATIKREYKRKILSEMELVFPDLPSDSLHTIADYIVITSLGLGEIEILLKDKFLEEIVVNNSDEPIWAYHKKHGWLETNVVIDEEGKTIHYATLAGRNVDKTITTLNPLMDAHLESGDRVNATLTPISTRGNTITIRKFAESPWTITDFITNGTLDYTTAAIVWTAIQYELSILIVGGTGSGKTSTLNVFSIFIPPNQRVITIEDTRELQLPRTLHWVPMATRLPNPEGKGGVSMLDLLVNSLRMRPDRIVVGEIRRKKEAEVMFEAMHTGHSVYATLHANTVPEAITRLTTEPISISPSLLPAVDLMFVQNRNRRTNSRKTYQVAEIKENGSYNMLYAYNVKQDKIIKQNNPVQLYKTLELVAGLLKSEVDSEIKDKIKILKYLVSKKINNIEEIALLVKNYYVNKPWLMKKLFGGKN